MAFYSFRFFVFFPLIVAAYYTLPLRFRRVFLLTASYYFYFCFKPSFVLILLASTAVDYYLGIAVHRQRIKSKRKILFVVGLFNNLGLLFLFKYFNFFNDTLRALFESVNILYDVKSIQWVLPVGISYYTFKKISYLIDVYRETLPPERNAVTFALYTSFFPAVTAGPIDRPGSLMPQFKKQVKFDYHGVTEGLKLMAWGFFKKLIIADRLALFVNQVYDNPTQYEGLSLVMATIYFSFQVYCDFSGYTDIAVGAGKVMGFDLMDNFNRPYFAVSIGEFWKRWHISLSSWLMDYLFLPIAYAVSRRIKNPVLLKFKAETWAYVTGIIVTMMLCGIWHGAKWTFLIWGAVHGLYMAASFATRKLRRKVRKKLKFGKKALIPNLLRVALTFGFVTFAWIFFRADSLSDAVYIINHLFTGWSKVLNVQGFLASLHFGLLKKELAVAGAALAVMLLVHLLRKTGTFGEWIAQRKPILRWSFYVVLLVWLLVFAESGSEQFIYFRF